MIPSENELFQKILEKLVDEYGYSINQVGVEVKISDRLRADCVIYTNERKTTPLIVVEVKSPLNYPLGVEQLATYMRLTRAQYGMLTDGVEKFFFRLVGKDIMEVADIPKKGEKESKALRKQDLKPAIRLDYKLQRIYDNILLGEKLSPDNALKEIEKLMLCKLEDEKSPREIPLFWVSPSEAEKISRMEIQQTILNRINSLFSEVKKGYPLLYPKGEKLNLSPHSLSKAVTQFQTFSLTQTARDVSSAYTQFISKSMYGYLGQYFTPKPLVDFIVKLLNPSLRERVLDPACGSGGFLISTVNYVWADHEAQELFRSKRKTRYAKRKIFGIDINPKMVSICKMNMLLQGDGHENIFVADFLSNLRAIKKVEPGSFDVVVADPPISQIVSDSKILSNFELGQSRNSQRIDVLFLEKCIAMLKPKGRMAIVFSERLLTSPSLNYIRKFLLKNTLIKAIINLPARTLIPYSGIETSVALMQKKERSREYEDYDVFMAKAFDAKEETLDEIVKKYRQSLGGV